jgi:hypothetical protein
MPHFVDDLARHALRWAGELTTNVCPPVHAARFARRAGERRVL